MYEYQGKRQPTAHQCSVPEAAKLLGISIQRVHQRISDGSLPAHKVGGRYVIDLRDVLALRGSRPAGRPYSPRSAWNVAALDSGHPAADALDRPARSRAVGRVHSLRNVVAKYAEAGDVDNLRESLSRTLSRLSERRAFRASARDLPDMRNDSRLVLAGVSHPQANIAAADIVEAYLRPNDFDDVIDDYLLSESSPREANVLLHVADAPNAAIDIVPHSRLVLAADLMRHEGPREQGEALRAINDWLQEVGHA